VGELEKSQKIQRMSIFVEKEQNKFSEEPELFIFHNSVVVQSTLRVLPSLVFEQLSMSVWKYSLANQCSLASYKVEVNVHWCAAKHY